MSRRINVHPQYIVKVRNATGRVTRTMRTYNNLPAAAAYSGRLTDDLGWDVFVQVVR